MIDQQAQSRGTRGITIVLLLALLLLATGLRLYRIADHSVWFDEYNALLLDRDADFGLHMAHIRQMNPDHMPLYFLGVYAWMKYVSMDPVVLRGLNTFFSLLTIAVLYLLGRRLGQPRAGLWACLFLALSPTNIYFGHSLRYESLALFMSAASIYSFASAVHTSRRAWWVAHVLVNNVLAWTHLTALLLVALHFLWLCLRRRDLRLIALYPVLHLPAAAAVLYWLPSLALEGLGWFSMPSLMQWLNDLLGDDALHYSILSMSQYDTFSWLSGSVAKGWLEAHVVFDTMLMGFFASALLWALLRFRGAARCGLRERFGYLLLLALGPILLLTVISLVWEPVIQPRYTQYSALALYLLAGMMLARLPRKRIPAVALGVCVLFGYQLSLALSNHSRSDWNGAARYVLESATERDEILFADIYDGSKTGPGMFRLALGDAVPFRTELTLHSALNTALDTLQGPAPGHVWLVFEQPLEWPAGDQLEARLRWQGLRIVDRHFTDLTVLRISGAPRPPQTGEAPPSLDPTDLASVARTLGLVDDRSTSEQREAALHALRLTYPYAGPPLPKNLATIAIQLAEVEPALGERAARHALAGAPDAVHLRLSLGLSLLAQGREDEARAELAQCCSAPGGGPYGAFACLYTRGDTDAASRLLIEMEKAGLWVPRRVLEQTGLLPAPSAGL